MSRKSIVQKEAEAIVDETAAEFHRRIQAFFIDRYSVYCDFIPRECRIQTKAETHLIESNIFLQRDWLARFRRKTCGVSRSIEMIDLAMFLYEAFHVNKSINAII